MKLIADIVRKIKKVFSILYLVIAVFALVILLLLLKGEYVGAITLFATLIAAYYTFKSYKDNQPPRLCLEVHYFNKDRKNLSVINVESINRFINLIVPEGHVIMLGYTSNYYFPMGIPYIINRSRKSMKNFKLEIDFFYSHLRFIDDVVSEDFEYVDVTDSDSLDFCGLKRVKFKYKHDILYAQCAIPVPLRMMGVDIPNSEIATWNYQAFAHFNYYIVYDGITKPVDFSVSYTVYFDDFCRLKDDVYHCSNTELMGVTEEHIDEFLTKTYSNHLRFEDLDKMVTVVDGDNSMIFNLPKNLTDAKFEKHKKEFIEDYYMNRNNEERKNRKIKQCQH